MVSFPACKAVASLSLLLAVPACPWQRILDDDVQADAEVAQTLDQPGRVFAGDAFSCNDRDYFTAVRENGGEVETQVYDCTAGTCTEDDLLPLPVAECGCSPDQTAVCLGVEAGPATVAYVKSPGGVFARQELGFGRSPDLYAYPDGELGCGFLQSQSPGQLEIYRFQNGVWSKEGSFTTLPGEGHLWDPALGATQFRIIPVFDFLVLFRPQVFQGLTRYTLNTLGENFAVIGQTLILDTASMPVAGSRMTPSQCVLGYVDNQVVVSNQPAGPVEETATVVCAAYTGNSALSLYRAEVGEAGLAGTCRRDVLARFKEPFEDTPGLALVPDWNRSSPGFLGGLFSASDAFLYGVEDGSSNLATLLGAPPELVVRAAPAFDLPGHSGPVLSRILAIGTADSASNLQSLVYSLAEPAPASPQQAGGDAVEVVSISLFHRISFPQFGDGGGFFSQITLSNSDPRNTASARIRFRNPQGEPISFELSGDRLQVPGSNAAGVVEVEIPPGGRLTVQTDGEGEVTVGSAVVDSNRRLSGVILFGGPFGLAGVGAVTTIPSGFSAPVETITESAVDTGVAITSLSGSPVRLTATLLRQDSSSLATAAPVDLLPQGQRALFVTEFQWDSNLDFSNFKGTLRIAADGPIAAAAIQTRPGQFATLPVTPF